MAHLSAFMLPCALSDVYVFGVKEKVNKEELNSLASKKRGETHVFILKDYDKLGEVFNSIISKWKSTLHSNIKQPNETTLVIYLSHFMFVEKNKSEKLKWKHSFV